MSVSLSFAQSFFMGPKAQAMNWGFTWFNAVAPTHHSSFTSYSQTQEDFKERQLPYAKNCTLLPDWSFNSRNEVVFDLLVVNKVGQPVKENVSSLVHFEVIEEASGKVVSNGNKKVTFISGKLYQLLFRPSSLVYLHKHQPRESSPRQLRKEGHQNLKSNFQF